MAPPFTSAWLLVKFHSIIDETQDCLLSHTNVTAAPCVAMFESNILLLIDTLHDFEYRALNRVLFNFVKLLEVILTWESNILKALSLFTIKIISLLYTLTLLNVNTTEFVLLILWFFKLKKFELMALMNSEFDNEI